jgi:hypothetical protein
MKTGTVLAAFRTWAARARHKVKLAKPLCVELCEHSARMYISSAKLPRRSRAYKAVRVADRGVVAANCIMHVDGTG